MAPRRSSWQSDPDGDRVIRFCSQLCGSGEYKGQRVQIRPWQEKIIRQLFGSKDRNNRRLIKTLFLALPRKQGKTSLISLLVLYLLVGEGKQGQVIYSVSGCQEQAKQIYEYCVDAIDASPYLSKRLLVYRNTCKIVDKQTGNYFVAIPADKEGKRKMGKNISVAIFDECAFWHDEFFHNSITTSMAARSEPLKIYISTAGFEQNCWFYREWQYALAVRDGTIKDPHYLPVIFAADPTDDPFSETTWRKAMPALGDFCSLEQIRLEFEKARHNPALLDYFKAVYLNLWTQHTSSYFNLTDWDQCKGNFSDDDLKDWECIGGYDQGIVKDLTSLSLLFRKGGRYRVKSWSWKPKEGVEESERADLAPYRQWAQAGWLRLTDGSSANAKQITSDVLDICKKYNVKKLLADRAYAYQIAAEFEAGGLQVEWYSQGIMAMSLPTKKLQALVLEQLIEHDGNPLLRFALSNIAVKIDENENVKPVKKDGKDGHCRIDPALALIQALGGTLDAESVPVKKPSVYENRGLLVLG